MSIEENTQERNSVADQSRARPTLPSQTGVLFKYVLLALTAFFLTLYSPGTHLWVSGGDQVTLDNERFAELVMVLMLTLLSLYMVQGSDPGYLNADIVSSVFQEDELSLLEHSDGTEASSGIKEVTLNEKPRKVDVTRRTTAAGLQVSASPLSTDPPSPKSEDQGVQNELESPYFQGTRRKVCETCQFAPPLRAHHCRFCDKCVATFDHHCMFIGTCIGERNHCRFWWFLTAQLMGFLVCSSIVGSSILGFTTLYREASRDSLFVVAAKVYLYPLTFTALLMWIGHTGFALANRTTFECSKGPNHIDYLRGTRETDLPFSSGLDGNLQLFCCQKDAFCECLTGAKEWKPIIWKAPGKIVRDSDDWLEHPWQNKYWSCC